MNLNSVVDDIYRISTFVQERDQGFNQYLLLDDKTALVHSGPIQTFDGLVEKIRELTEPEDIDYLVISHFEADECGALSELLKVNRGLTPVCSEVTARHLSGFGLYEKPHIVGEGDTLNLGSKSLLFLDYPSEAHLMNGIVAYESMNQILFSADLFMRRGREGQPTLEADLPNLIASIGEDRIASPTKREEMIAKLSQLTLKIIAPGHGPVLKARS